MKDKIGCTGNSIKLLFQTATKYVNHDFEKYGIYVFKYDKNKCAKILFEIISFVHLHSNDKKKTELFGHSVNLDTYISILYGEQLTSLEWVRDHNYKKQYEDAQNILNRIDEIRAELK